MRDRSSTTPNRSQARACFQALGAAILIAAAAASAQPVATFEPAGEPVAGSIRFEVDPLAPVGPDLELSLVADQVTDLYGVSFTLRFPNRLVKLEGDPEPGTFLSEDGAVVTTQLVTRRGARFLIVGLTRVGPEPGVDGSGTLLTLRFRARGSLGRGKLLWSDMDAVDSDGNVMDEMVWQQGLIDVR